MILVDYDLHRPYTQQRLSEASAQRIAHEYAGPRHSAALTHLRSSSVRAPRQWLCQLLARASSFAGGTRSALAHSAER